MGHEQSQNAMTEIALALAMAFFAIMVLAMISMGAQVAAVQQPKSEEASTKVVAASLRENSPNDKEAAKTEIQAKDIIVIHWQGRFYDAAAKDLDPATLSQTQSRVILALAPGLPLEQALAIRGQINSQNLIVSTLSPDWVQRLRRINP